MALSAPALALALLLMSTLHPASCGAGERAEMVDKSAAAGKVLMVVIDRIGIDDISESGSPNIMKLIARGGTSLMNARVKYEQYGLGSYTVIGSGGRAMGGAGSGLSFNYEERLKTGTGGFIRAGDIYDSRTGRRARPGQVLNLYIEEMIKKSDTPLATSIPGLMGQALRAGEKKVAVLGNADSLVPASAVDVPPSLEQQDSSGVDLEEYEPGEDSVAGRQPYPLKSLLHREIASIAMDENGAVRAGDVSNGLLTGFSSSEGAVTDFAALEREASALMRSSDVLVIDLGQTTRVDEQADFFSEDALDAARRRALKACDESLGRLQGLIDLEKDLIVVCTPTPTRKMIKDGELLTPLVMAGKDFDKGGRLRSATTRRAGLVSNFDIAPTVIEFAGLEVPAEMDGRPITVSGTNADLPGLRSLRDAAVSASTSRKTMVRIFVITSMCIIALFFLVILIRRDMIMRHPFLWSAALLAILAGPFVWLAVPAMGPVPLAVLIVVSVCASIASGLLLLLLRDRSSDARGSAVSGVLLKPLLTLSGFTLLLILLDLVMGSSLMTFSAFGSDLVMGDRYYGLGNLFFGFALGSAILFTCVGIQTREQGLMSYLKLDRPSRRYAFAGITLGIVAIIIGFPRLGADFGGLIAVVAAGLVTIMRLEGKPLTAKRIAVALLILAVCVAGLLLLDSLMPGTASHAGKALGKAKQSGLSSLTSQVSRKLAANWTLTWSSLWRLLLLFGVVAWLVLNWRFGVLKYVKERYPYMSAGFWGLVVGLVTAWLLNDSGIESAAAISVFLFVPYFVMLVPWRRENGGTAEET